MKITLRLGEPFWRTLGRREVELVLDNGATVADALAALTAAHPALIAELRDGDAEPSLFLEDEVAPPDSRLTDGARLYLVWPVSGGSCAARH
jgi:molybdopterin converting factor small subunit